MSNKFKIMTTTIVILIIQIFVSYLAYIGISDRHELVKVLIILALNWGIAIFGAMFLLNDYKKLFVSIKSIYYKHQLTSILYDLLKALADMENQNDVYKMVLDAAKKAIPSAKFGSVIMSNNGRFKFESSFGFKHEYLELIELNIEDTALYISTNGKMDKSVIISDILAINSGDIEKETIDLFLKAGVSKIRSTVSAPISIGKITVGCINLDSDRVNCFKKDDKEMLELFAYEVSKVVELHQTLELNKNMSRIDDLTKIYNRGYSNQIIKELIVDKKPFVLVSVDLDNLKVTNDVYGHDAGDRLIVNFVNNMKLFLPNEVLFSRYGGDEFVLIFEGKTVLEASVVMEDAKKFFEAYTIENDLAPIYVSFSYGVSSYPDETGTYDQLLKLADTRMYEQKRISKMKKHSLEKMDL